MSDAVQKLTAIQKTMAKHLVASWTDVPQFSVECEIECEALKEYREKLEFKTSFTTVIIKAVAMALKQHPRFTSFWNGDNIIEKKDINIGVAMDTARGLLVPVIHHADEMTVKNIHDRMEEYKARIPKGNFTMEQISDGTFTISNLGMFCVSRFTAVVNAPQSAILALSSMSEVPVVKNGKIVSSVMMRATVSADHRVLDGAEVSRFLMDLKHILENLQAML